MYYKMNDKITLKESLELCLTILNVKCKRLDTSGDTFDLLRSVGVKTTDPAFKFLFPHLNVKYSNPDEKIEEKITVQEDGTRVITHRQIIEEVITISEQKIPSKKECKEPKKVEEKPTKVDEKPTKVEKKSKNRHEFKKPVYSDDFFKSFVDGTYTAPKNSNADNIKPNDEIDEIDIDNLELLEDDGGKNEVCDKCKQPGCYYPKRIAERWINRDPCDDYTVDDLHHYCRACKHHLVKEIEGDTSTPICDICLTPKKCRSCDKEMLFHGGLERCTKCMNIHERVNYHIKHPDCLELLEDEDDKEQEEQEKLKKKFQKEISGNKLIDLTKVKTEEIKNRLEDEDDDIPSFEEWA